MKSSIIFLLVVTLWSSAQGKPGLGHFLYSFPAPSQHTTVVRDALGNQATAYAYQDGHSSSVAVSRNDVSKHLSYVPVAVAAPQPHIVYEEPLAYTGPAYHHQSPDYFGGGYYSYY